MLRRLTRVVLGVGIALTSAAAPANDRISTLPAAPGAAEQRHALVVGNSAYSFGALRNPVNDARAMAQALSKVGFEVILAEDATQAGMQRAIREFGDRLLKGGVGLFYFAGHGIQVKGRNFLVPVNADIKREDEIEFGSVDVNQVLAKMDSAKNPLNIVILDACRNNPFARSFRASQVGLAQMDAPSGTFIAFATAPGSIASDGGGEHGLYTKHLLGELARPGLPIEQVFKQVRIGVMADTNNQQTPWESSSLRGEFVFVPGQAGAPAAAAPAPAPARAPADSAVEVSFWESVRASGSAADLRAYLERYPRGQFAVLARNRLAALEPQPAPAPAPAKPAPAQVASVAPGALASRFPRVGDTWTYRLREPKRVDVPTERRYEVTVAAVSERSILDTFTLEAGRAGQASHGAGPRLVHTAAAVFSPYIGVFAELAPGADLGAIPDVLQSACGGSWNCQAEVKSVSREKVTVPAGTFDAIKVVVEHVWQPINLFGEDAAGYLGGRTLTAWFAPQAKRVVKFASRLESGRVPPVYADFELELLSYKLN